MATPLLLIRVEERPISVRARILLGSVNSSFCAELVVFVGIYGIGILRVLPIYGGLM